MKDALARANNLKWLNERFEYRYDKETTGESEAWFFMTPDPDTGKLYGDCEDYSLTIAKADAGGLWALFCEYLKGTVGIYYCANRTTGVGHAVLCVDGQWIDNQHMAWGGKERIEKRYYIKRRYSTLKVIIKLIKGAIAQIF